MSSLTLADARLLWALGPLFLVWLGLLWLAARSRRTHATVRYSAVALLGERGGSGTSLLWRRFFQALRMVSVALLMVAMMRPQTGRARTEVSTRGIDILLVLDTSGSMQALDLDSDREISKRRNRLEVAKAVVERFIDARTSDQIGMVVFGEEAFTQAPLTLDHGILSTLLERVDIGVAGDATAIGSAVGLAVKRLRDSEAESKVVILLTDGVSNAGTLAPMTAAEVAKTFDVRIYTIGVGAEGEAPFLVRTALGPQVRYQQNMIDEDTLRAMAELTDGEYFRAIDAGALEDVYQRIDELEKTEIETARYLEYTDRYRWLLGPALLLLLLEVVFLRTRFRKLP